MIPSEDIFQGAAWRKYPLPSQIRIEALKDRRLKEPVRLHIGGNIIYKFKNKEEARTFITNKVLPAFATVMLGFESVAKGEKDSYSATDAYTQFKGGPSPLSPPPGTPIAIAS